MPRHEFFKTSDDAAYWRWIEQFDTRSPSALARLAQRAEVAAGGLSICIIPICEPQSAAAGLAHFRDMLES